MIPDLNNKMALIWSVPYCGNQSQEKGMLIAGRLLDSCVAPVRCTWKPFEMFEKLPDRRN